MEIKKEFIYIIKIIKNKNNVIWIPVIYLSMKNKIYSTLDSNVQQRRRSPISCREKASAFGPLPLDISNMCTRGYFTRK